MSADTSTADPVQFVLDEAWLLNAYLLPDEVLMDFDPVKLSREAMLKFCEEMNPQAIRDIFPVGTPKEVARKIKGFADAGMRVYKLMEYGGMGGMKFSATSAAKVRETEDEIQKLVEG